MSGTTGAPAPDDDPAGGDRSTSGDAAAGSAGPANGAAAPYPGWSPQQPGWPPHQPPHQAPQQPPGWSGPQPGGTGDQPGGTGDQPGGTGGQPPASGWEAGGWGPAAGGNQPGWGGPSGWDPAGGWGRQGGPSGAAGGPGPGGSRAWQVPDAKPGVIPLRPLGVTEILDGAITTIRRNLAAMLGLSAVVAVVTQVLSAAVLAWVFGDQITEPDLGLSDAEALETVARGVPAALLGWLVTLIATVFLTGVLTVVVGRAVLGRDLTIGQAWRESKGRLPRLLGLTLVYTLIWFAPGIAVVALAIGLGLVGGPVAVVFLGFAGLAALPLTVWLYVRYALSTPALMLETTTTADGTVRPVRIIESLRRSAALVRTSWWRVFAILLLIFIIVILINQVVAVPFGVPGLIGSNATDDPVTWYILNTLAGMIAATITAPFSAAATALLYIDRRIRREGLDIDLARAAGVELPGRGDPGAPPGPP